MRARSAGMVAVGMALVVASVGWGPARAATGDVKPYLMYVFSNPTPGREGEFLSWYRDQHLRDAVRVPGTVDGQMYRNDLATTGPSGRSDLPRYLALYRIRTSDIAGMVAQIRSDVSSGRTQLSPAVDAKSFVVFIYRVAGGALPGGNLTRLTLVAAPPGGTPAVQRWFDRSARQPSTPHAAWMSIAPVSPSAAIATPFAIAGDAPVTLPPAIARNASRLSFTAIGARVVADCATMEPRIQPCG